MKEQTKICTELSKKNVFIKLSISEEATETEVKEYLATIDILTCTYFGYKVIRQEYSKITKSKEDTK